MTNSQRNSGRFDPYKNYKFRVSWDGRYVAGFSKVGALIKSTESVEQAKSVQNKSFGVSNHDALVLERGVTHDVDFEKWANQVWNPKMDRATEVSLKGFRKNITIDLYNEAGQLAKSWRVFSCWVSELQALAELDSDANAVMIQSIKLENEGWELDSASDTSASQSSAEPH